jgi:hypothetical protein
LAFPGQGAHRCPTRRRTKSDIGRIIADLKVKLTQHPGDEDLANAEVRDLAWQRRDAVRTRRSQAGPGGGAVLP